MRNQPSSILEAYPKKLRHLLTGRKKCWPARSRLTSAPRHYATIVFPISPIISSFRSEAKKLNPSSWALPTERSAYQHRIETETRIETSRFLPPTFFIGGRSKFGILKMSNFYISSYLVQVRTGIESGLFSRTGLFPSLYRVRGVVLMKSTQFGTSAPTR